MCAASAVYDISPNFVQEFVQLFRGIADMSAHDKKHCECKEFFNHYGPDLMSMRRKYKLEPFPSTHKAPISIAALAKFVFPVAMANGVLGAPRRVSAASASASASAFSYSATSLSNSLFSPSQNPQKLPDKYEYSLSVNLLGVPIADQKYKKRRLKGQLDEESRAKRKEEENARKLEEEEKLKRAKQEEEDNRRKMEEEAQERRAIFAKEEEQQAREEDEQQARAEEGLKLLQQQVREEEEALAKQQADQAAEQKRREDAEAEAKEVQVAHFTLLGEHT